MYPTVNNQQTSDTASESQTPYFIASERIRRIEAEKDLLQYQLGGWCVWPLLRFYVAYRIASQSESGPTSKISLREQIPTALRDVFALFTLRRTPYAVFVQSSNRSEKQGVLYKDVYFDDLLAELGHFTKVEAVVNRQFMDRNRLALMKSAITNTHIQLLAKIFTRLGGPQRAEAIGHALYNHLQQDFGMELFTPDNMVKHLRHFYWAKQFYGLLLNRIRPKYLLMVTAYTYHPLVAAAKERGITVVEFQHGVLSRHHPGYSWTSYALPYKAKMPIPDRLFLYGDYWKGELESYGFWGDELYPVGSLRMDKYRSEKPTGEAGSRMLVVTTQNLDTDRLIAFLAEFLELSKERSDFRLVIKLHPGETSKDKYTAMFQDNPNVSILMSSEEPSTFQLLKQADWHISIYSTCHFEALCLGTPTIILPLTNHRTVLHLLDTGYAFLAQTPQELLKITMQPKLSVPAEAGDYYFSAGAIQNIKRALS